MFLYSFFFFFFILTYININILNKVNKIHGNIISNTQNPLRSEPYVRDNVNIEILLKLIINTKKLLYCIIKKKKNNNNDNNNNNNYNNIVYVKRKHRTK